MTVATLEKDPQATLPYRFDWKTWLPTGVTISTSTWTIPAGLTKVAEAIENGTTAAVTISGGIAGTSYTITNHIVATDGTQDDRSLTIKVQER